MKLGVNLSKAVTELFIGPLAEQGGGIVSVNGQTGTVVLNTEHISESGGKFYAKKDNFSSIVNPTTSDNTSLGYDIGSMWINTITKETFICYASTIANATWYKIHGLNTLFSHFMIPNTNNVWNSYSTTQHQNLGITPNLSYTGSGIRNIKNYIHCPSDMNETISLRYYFVPISTTHIGSITIQLECHSPLQQTNPWFLNNSNSTVILNPNYTGFSNTLVYIDITNLLIGGSHTLTSLQSTNITTSITHNLIGGGINIKSFGILLIYK